MRAVRSLANILLSPSCLLEAVTLVDHVEEEVANLAESFVDSIYRTCVAGAAKSTEASASSGKDVSAGAGAGAGAGSSQESKAEAEAYEGVVPFIEAGCVPELYRLMGSERERTVHFAERLLKQLQSGARGSVLAQLCSVIASDADLAKRVVVAVALVYVR